MPWLVILESCALHAASSPEEGRFDMQSAWRSGVAIAVQHAKSAAQEGDPPLLLLHATARIDPKDTKLGHRVNADLGRAMGGAP